MIGIIARETWHECERICERKGKVFLELYPNALLGTGERKENTTFGDW